MNENEYTPGPRTIYAPSSIWPNKPWRIESDEGNLLVEIVESDNPEADAHLIAVIPELLEALEDLVRTCESKAVRVYGERPRSDWVYAARDILTKARGESNS